MDNKRDILLFTGTRAEYGLLRRLMSALLEQPGVRTRFLVSGAHLAPSLGMTVQEIEADGFAIAERVPMQLDGDSRLSAAMSLGLGVMQLAGSLDRLKPDILVVLGDRFEALAAVQAALMLGVAVAHLHGGELSYGAVDDMIRHAITKFSTLHFAATKEAHRRIVQLGEAEDRVFWVGALGVEAISKEASLSREELQARFGLHPARPFVLLTYHPETATEHKPDQQVRELYAALEQALEAGGPLDGFDILLTGSNADFGGRIMDAASKAFAQRHPDRARFFGHLGRVGYVSAMAHAKAVLGNSSSGILEAASLGTPSLDIGQRQAGRERAASVVHCECETADILRGLTDVLSPAYADSARGSNPYEKADTAAEIARLLAQSPLASGQSKHFIDLTGAPLRPAST